MKKKLYLLLLTILLIPCYVCALSYDSSIDERIDNIVSSEEGYIKVVDNKLYSYINDELISTKEFIDLNKISLIKYNENYILVGIKNNTIKTYIIDNKLKVLKTEDTSFIITDGTPNLYLYNNKTYLLFINNGILTTNNIYVIDEELNIEETKLSNIENIKDIIKSDYYIINDSGNTIDELTEYYNNSTYINNDSIIVGYVENNTMEKNAYIKLIDNDGYIKWQDNNKDYIEFKDCIILENKIYILANNGLNTFLVEYDQNGKAINTTKIADTISYKFIKVGNKLYILNQDKQLIYNYEININIENSIYGTTTFIGEAIPYKEVELNTIANSGYTVKNIIVKDEQGNQINVDSNKFKMPTSNVTISVEYEETIINPETVDMIFIVMALCGVALIIFTKTYKQYKWLKG